jgi:hypothetical protein
LNVEISQLTIVNHEWFTMGMAINVLLYLKRMRAAEAAAPQELLLVTVTCFPGPTGAATVATGTAIDGDRRLLAGCLLLKHESGPREPAAR